MQARYGLGRRPVGRRIAVTVIVVAFIGVLAFITDLRVTAHILEHLGLASDAVPIAPARSAR